VMLKEQRKLVIVPRETPLNTIHIRNLLTLSEMGVSIVPPMPAFYNHPETVDDVIRHIVARVLDQFGIDNELTVRWGVTRRLHAKPARPRAPARLDDRANVGRPAAATASIPNNMGDSRAEGDLLGHRITSLDRHAAEADASWTPE
jgi:flavoprotein